MNQSMSISTRMSYLLDSLALQLSLFGQDGLNRSLMRINLWPQLGRIHVVVVPGDLKIRHHFHLVQISFRAADSIRDYMKNLLIRPDEEESYINAFELEEILEDLSAVIGTTHNVKAKLGKGSDDTLFILNIDLNTANESVKYSYRNGFSKNDLSSMAGDAEIGIAVDKILEIKRANRIDLPATTTYPLFEPKKSIEDYTERQNVGR